MALVVVSSRECDSVYGDPYRISTLYGEIVGIERTAQSTVGVHRITEEMRRHTEAAVAPDLSPRPTTHLVTQPVATTAQ
jgi:hypothetical protein